MNHIPSHSSLLNYFHFYSCMLVFYLNVKLHTLSSAAYLKKMCESDAICQRPCRRHYEYAYCWLVIEIVFVEMQSDANVKLPKALKICMFLVLVRDFCYLWVFGFFVVLGGLGSVHHKEDRVRSYLPDLGRWEFWNGCRSGRLGWQHELRGLKTCALVGDHWGDKSWFEGRIVLERILRELCRTN